MKAIFDVGKDDVLIKLYGELDEYGASKIKDDVDKCIARHPARAYIFDLENVQFVDSTGLGFLLGRYKKIRQNHAELLVSHVCPQVDKVFKAAGVYTFVPKINL